MKIIYVNQKPDVQKNAVYVDWMCQVYENTTKAHNIAKQTTCKDLVDATNEIKRLNEFKFLSDTEGK